MWSGEAGFVGSRWCEARQLGYGVLRYVPVRRGVLRQGSVGSVKAVAVRWGLARRGMFCFGELRYGSQGGVG